MINENADMAKAEANARVVDDLNQAQASYMQARAEKKKAEEMVMADKQN